MALTNHKIKSTDELLRELKMFGGAFFSLYDYFQHRADYQSLKLQDIKPILEEMKIMNNEKKLSLYENLEDINDYDCSRLTSILQAEVHYQQVVNILHLLEGVKKNHCISSAAATLVRSYFLQLYLFMTKSDQWMRDSQLNEKLKGYFIQIVEDLKVNREIYKEKVTASSIWHESIESNADDELTQANSYHEKLDLLRNIRLIDRVIHTLESNIEKQSYFLNDLYMDNKILYYIWKESDL